MCVLCGGGGGENERKIAQDRRERARNIYKYHILAMKIFKEKVMMQTWENVSS